MQQRKNVLIVNFNAFRTVVLEKLTY